MPTPFDDVEFLASQGSVNNDEIVNLLTQDSRGPFAGSSVDSSQKKGTPNINMDEGAKRVNENTRQSGVIAYRDPATGVMTLTNVAKDPITGEDKPIAALFKPSPTGGSYSAQSKVPADKMFGSPESGMDLLGSIRSLTNTDNPEAGQVLYQNIQAALTQTKAELHQQALDYAKGKMGVSVLEQELMLSEQRQKADPKWYPGIGDAPITQGIRAELARANLQAQQEAQNFLVSNYRYTSLAGLEKQADEAWKRVQNVKEKREQSTFLSEQRMADKKQNREEQSLAEFGGLTPEQAKRVAVLASVSPDSLGDNEDNQMTVARVFKQNKFNPAFKEALNAPDKEGLLSLVLTGKNDFARQLLGAQEKVLNPDELDNNIKLLKDKLKDRGLEEEVQKLIRSKGKAGQKKADEMKARMDELKRDNTKAPEVNAARVGLVMEWAQHHATEQFNNNVETWKSVDPELAAAIKIAKDRTGKKDIENVATAFVMGKDGNVQAGLIPERIKQFENLMKTAYKGQSNSVIPAPNLEATLSKFGDMVVSKQWIRKSFTDQFKSDVSDISNMLPNFLFGN
jgi:hypothetical protein